MKSLGAGDLYDIETYSRREGCTEFVYDVALDLFRFSEDGEVAFSRKFADWKRLARARIPGLLSESGLVVSSQGDANINDIAMMANATNTKPSTAVVTTSSSRQDTTKTQATITASVATTRDSRPLKL